MATWTSTQPLPVTTGVGKFPDRKYKLLRAAPRLASGWTLVGETAKFVSVSPQRIVVHRSRVEGRSRVEEGRSRVEGDLLGEAPASLSFSVVGAVGEEVQLTVVAPAGLVVAVTAVIGSSGSVNVTCRDEACVV